MPKLITTILDIVIDVLILIILSLFIILMRKDRKDGEKTENSKEKLAETMLVSVIVLNLIAIITKICLEIIIIFML